MAEDEKWVDVTEALKRGVQDLKIGEMLQRSDFSVEQAMSAIEIGDPRMDFVVDPEMHAPALVEAGKLVIDLSMGQTACLLDCLTAKLAQWWMGRPLQQTVYTSLHVVMQEKLKERPLLAAAAGLISGLVSMGKHIIAQSGVINDEDCSVLSVVEDEPPVDTAQIQYLTEVTSRALEACAAVNDEQEAAAAKAVVARLLLLKHLLQALKSMTIPSKSQVERARGSLKQASSALADTIATQPAVPTMTEPPGIFPDLHLTSYSLPPPAISPLSNAGTRAVLTSALEELTAMCALTNEVDFGSMLRLSEHLSRRCSVPICRGVLFLLLAPAEVRDEDELPEWAPRQRQFMQQLHLPQNLLSQAPALRLFLEQAHVAVCNHLQGLCLNRARVRRRLRKGLDDWERMRAHAANADHSDDVHLFLCQERNGWAPKMGTVEAPEPCQLWIASLTLVSMLEHLFMGFELGLYTSSEYATVFAYCQFLLDNKMRAEHLFLVSRPKQLKAGPKKAGKETKSPSKKKGKAPAKQAPPVPSLTPEEYTRVAYEQFRLGVTELQRLLCAACCKLAATLEAKQVIRSCEGAFGSHKGRYLQRFEAFQAIGDGLYVPFEHAHIQLAPPKDGADKLFAEALAKVDQLLNHMTSQHLTIPEWERDELRKMGLVAKRNLTASRLVQGLPTYSDKPQLSGTWEFQLHRCFPAVALKRAT